MRGAVESEMRGLWGVEGTSWKDEIYGAWAWNVVCWRNEIYGL